MFQKGASLATAMAFQFASTNLVFEIGIVMWIFIGWEFTLAEFVGGIFLITFMWAAVRLFVARRLEEAGRQHALAAASGHEHHMAGAEGLTLTAAPLAFLAFVLLLSVRLLLTGRARRP